jgi:hypothetical protein
VYGSGLNRRRGGGGWTTDYPNADINMSIRLSELTKIDVSKDGAGRPNHLLVRIDGDELFQCPLVIMSAPERAVADDDGRIMVLMTNNTEIQNSWEREGDDASYFYAFSPRGYAFGINAFLYALTH